MKCARNTLLLFDLDGTLTAPRKKMERSVEDFLFAKKEKFTIGIVSGSDEFKIYEQINEQKAEQICDYLFAENGLVTYKNGELIKRQSIVGSIGEAEVQKFMNFTLGLLSKIELPFKRGTFIELRNGMFNISPVGRGCSAEERDVFEKYDKDRGVRSKLINALKNEFQYLNLQYSIGKRFPFDSTDTINLATGGQISFDVFRDGWDKRYCLDILKKDGFKEIHFFGDKTDPGGNDHEIFLDSRVIGHRVNNPLDTLKQINEICEKDSDS